MRPDRCGAIAFALVLCQPTFAYRTGQGAAQKPNTSGCQHQIAWVHVIFPDGSSADFPYIWLRDNDPAGFHPQTQERIADLTAIPLDVTPDKIDTTDTTLTIWWQGEKTVSTFDLNWLSAHRPGQYAADPARTGFTHWRKDLGAAGVPRAKADAILNSDQPFWPLATM